MADEDAGRTPPSERGRRDGDDDLGFGFSLPPILLPDVRLPERIRLVFPVPDPPEKVSRPTRVRVSWVLLAVALVDALDAFAVLWAGPATLPWVRAVVGMATAIVLVSGPGLLYSWELLAILGGFGWLSVAPTLTALVLARILIGSRR
ncbi:hypothetical protein [Halorussus lipolyticus]|uniref:hypothetical protein n=1 Tax=Halorussus lipolyticus TaxID=3034024 RepID=UPI0023E8385F|nr:hypothetical protein [Halorussus sp. DT80]